MTELPSPVFELYSLVWFPSNSPKMACSLLRALLNRLLTRDKLHNFGITQHMNCVLCDTGMESVQHFFFAYPFASYIWTLCKLKLKMNTTVLSLSEEAMKLSVVTFKRKSRASFISKACFAGTIWHIWQE